MPNSKPGRHDTTRYLQYEKSLQCSNSSSSSSSCNCYVLQVTCRAGFRRTASVMKVVGPSLTEKRDIHDDPRTTLHGLSLCMSEGRASVTMLMLKKKTGFWLPPAAASAPLPACSRSVACSCARKLRNALSEPYYFRQCFQRVDERCIFLKSRCCRDHHF